MLFIATNNSNEVQFLIDAPDALTARLISIKAAALGPIPRLSLCKQPRPSLPWAIRAATISSASKVRAAFSRLNLAPIDHDDGALEALLD